MTGEVLSRTTLVQNVTVLLFSFDGQRWDSDLKRLRAWHRNQVRGTACSWGDQRSAARGNRRSARAQRKNAHAKERHAETSEPGSDDESPPVVDGELLQLAAMMPM
jgi:hypothetical protein